MGTRPMIARIRCKGQADLFEVGKAVKLLGFLPGAAKCGKQHRGQNGDNRDDDNNSIKLKPDLYR